MKKLFFLLLFGAGCAQPKELYIPEFTTTKQAPVDVPEVTAPVKVGCGNGLREIFTTRGYPFGPSEGTKRRGFPLEVPEECDSNARGCDQTLCMLNQCGDGTLDPDESCDDGNTNSKDGCSSRCEIELNTPDNTFALADKHPLTITRESLFVGSLEDEAGTRSQEPDYVAFTLSFPAELVVLQLDIFECGDSTTGTTLYDKDKKQLWSVQRYPEIDTLRLEPGTYYLGLFSETSEYMLWFKDNPNPLSSAETQIN